MYVRGTVTSIITLMQSCSKVLAAILNWQTTMSTNFLGAISIQKTFCRFFKQQHNKKHIYRHAGNLKYFERIPYYPRDPNFTEPEVKDPPKLWRVQRFKRLSGTPFWERRILRDLGLVYNTGKDVAVVKNIPENNTRLMKIKHLVHIEPITFPHGEPTQSDTQHTFLKENGTCLVTKEVKVDQARIDATEKFINDSKRLDKDTLKHDALMKWLNPTE